jgi:tRNA (guanine37-N1)-methyltransferase
MFPVPCTPVEGSAVREKAPEKVLSCSLSPEDVECLGRSYDIVGDIVVLPMINVSAMNRRIVAETVMTRHKEVRTVLSQASPIQSDYRLRKLGRVLGEDKTAAIHKESGCLFSVDIAECYFSPRLAYERM